MSVIEFLTLLAEKDIRLWVEDGKLRFSAAEGAFTDEIKQEVVDRKSELIEFLSQAKKTQQQQIPQVPRDQALALSFAQQRLWFLNQLEPDNPSYNMPAAIRIQGKLDLAVLKKTFNEIIRRHEILRTVYLEQDETPLQDIHAAKDWPLEIETISTPTHCSETDFLKSLAQAEASKTFDLAQGPVMRSRLHQIASDDYVLLITVHHIASDGWSMGILVSEIVALYKAFCENPQASSPLPEPGIQYADYAAWQLTQLSGEKLERQLGYWKQQLQGTPILQMPSDYRRSAILGNQGGCINFSINQSLTQALKNLTQAQDATLFMTLLAAFSTLLHRFSQQDDFAIGIPVANRSHSSLDTLVGCFVNTLALRADLSDKPSFLELLSRIKNTSKEGFEHQDIPFEQVVDELNLSRDMSHTPVFQVMFTLQNAPMDQQVNLPGLNLELLEFESGTAQFELKLAISENDKTLDAAIEYNSELFKPETIERMIRYFKILLEHISRQPEQCIAHIPLISDEEKAQLLSTQGDAWNATEQSYPHCDALHLLFEQQVTRSPEAIAISFNGARLCYRELNIQANKLAHHLRSLGVGPDSLVGVCMERSLDMSIALLAILKAGGAYVPFDPSFPAERLAFMLSDTQAQLMLSQSHLSEQVPEGKAQVIFVDKDIDDWSEQANSNPVNQTKADKLFNVIYTSGSTGKPKGVMVPHQGIINRLLWMQEAYPLDSQDIVLQKTPYSFDVSVWELFWPLLVGARIEFAKADGHKDPDYLQQIIQDKGITTLHFVPSMLGIFLQTEGVRQCNSITRVFCSGEALQLEHERRFFEQLAGAELHNLYGPTEASVDVSYFACQSNSLYRSVPIGRPVTNTQLLILDENLQPVPIGIAGELYIGGVQLARGYLNREELSATTFIDNPFHASGHPSPRLYKSGDLARYLPDGNIDYIGRVDFQVKIRGLRIELGEIETVLHQHPDVKETLVITHEQGPDNVLIVAYWVPQSADKTPSTDDFRQHLRQQLPEYMLPNAFVMLEEIPLSANGKANRKALPAPELEESLSNEYIAPRNDIERALSKIWSDVLSVEKVGINDNFFELGGHSLLATRVAARIRKQFDIELKLRELFECTTVATLAEKIANPTTTSDNQLPLVTAQPREEQSSSFPLSIPQKRLWFIENLSKGNATYNMPAGLRIKGPLDIAQLTKSLNQLIARHEALRTSFHHNDQDGLQRVHDEAHIDLSQLTMPDSQESTKQALMDFASRAFDLSQTPLIRAQLLSGDSQQHILLLCVHHIVSDGWSQDIIVKDLMALYAGKADQLTALDIQYADYAHWQKTYLTEEFFAPQLSYWQSQLENLPKLELPTDYTRPSQLNADGSGINFNLDSELAGALRQFALQHAVTPYVVLLSTYQTLLYRYSGQEDFAIGTPVANRPQIELENIVGFFVNTLVLRTPIEELDTFASLQQRVKHNLLQAQQNLDIPFEHLVAELVKERDIAQTPLFQTSFSYQISQQQEQQVSHGDLSISPLWDQSSHYDIPVKFDLQCAFTDFGEGKAIQGSIEGRASLFSTETLAQLNAHFINLLQAIIKQPEQALLTLPILSGTERKQVLEDWNDTQVQRKPVAAIHQLFEQQVARTPTANAIRFDEQVLSYQQLNQQANQLARHLQSMGVGPDSMVGVCIERSLHMSVALLAILKAGGAYVPFDPSFPSERLGFMLEDTEASIMLSQSHLKENIPDGQITTICLDKDSEQWARQSSDNLPFTGTDDNLFNVIFTSGSTGKPKGVMVPHKGIINRLLWMQNTYPLDDSDHVLQKTPYSFDVSVWELFWPLIVGAQLVYAKPEGHKDPDYLRDIIRERNISTLHFVPTMLGIFLQTKDINTCSSIRRIFCSGEALQLEHEKRFFQQLDHAELHNLYGPTEASVDVSYYQCGASNKYNSVPIGKPVDNTQLYILDKNLAPVPLGVVGELYIGGVQLARGYLKREQLSRETFIDNPFFKEGHPSERLYKSGDLTRFLPDGNIEYIGRTDFQVKVRGLRIELGEIENVLHQHPVVQETIVITRDMGDGNVIIAAYIVAEDEKTIPPIDELRQYLGQHLPNYMIPNAFVTLDEIPMSANGKADRKALPEPDASHSVSAQYTPPRNETETRLVEIWQDTLGIDKVGIFDNFFELGGHSILAMQIANQALALFKVELELIKLFENPNIAAIAELLDEKITEQQLLMDDEVDEDDDEEFVL